MLSLIHFGLLWTGIATASALVGFLALQVAAASRVSIAKTSALARAADRSGASCEPSTVILIPAHNESSVIEGTLRAARRHADGERLIVVADNCTDETATIARAAGVEVVERTEYSKRGKGHAIAFGLDHLACNPPDVVVILDADCTVSPFAVKRLAAMAFSTDSPVQGRYLLKRANDKPTARVSEFAVIVKNMVRPLGLERLRLPTPLLGSGMAFPWRLLRGAEIGNSHVTEDLLLAVDLARKGVGVRYCPNARVTSVFPEKAEAVASQRRRWEHGYLDILTKQAPRLLWRGLTTQNRISFFLGLDLMIPPLSLLAASLAGATAWSALYATLQSDAAPLLAVFFIDVVFLATLLFAYARWGRRVLRWRDALSLPVYAISKIPLYADFFRNRQKEWVRTERDAREE